MSNALYLEFMLWATIGNPYDTPDEMWFCLEAVT